MMTHTMRGNPEESARGWFTPSPRRIMPACMARDVKWKDVPEPGHVEW